MNKPIIKIVDLADGSEIEREMNDDELKNYQLQQAQFELEKNMVIETAKARQALLDKLGITEEEAKLLLG